MKIYWVCWALGEAAWMTWVWFYWWNKAKKEYEWKW